MSTFKTSDFYLSAFLVASEVPMLDFERGNGRTSFEFATIHGLSQLIDQNYIWLPCAAPGRKWALSQKWSRAYTTFCWNPFPPGQPTHQPFEPPPEQSR